jgi:hypothetical protein
MNYRRRPPLSTILCRSFGMTWGLFLEHRENIAYPRRNYGLKTDRQAGTVTKKYSIRGFCGRLAGELNIGWLVLSNKGICP